MQDASSFGLGERAAAAIVGVSVTTLRRDRASGHAGGIPFVRVGARIIYVREALEDWLCARQQRPAPGVMTGAPRRLKRGRPSKKEQIEAARAGLTVAQLRERDAARAGGVA